MTLSSMTSSSNKLPSMFEIMSPGILSLIQDLGRFGQHSIGLTNGGPMDPIAFKWANRLLQNHANACVIETTVGGLKIKSNADTHIAVTGAKVSVKINGIEQPQWQTLLIGKNDIIELGYATQGCRIYLAVAGGFNITPQFGSASTVTRESVGGLTGKALAAADTLPLTSMTEQLPLMQLASKDIPEYDNQVTLRVIPGYQQNEFSRHDQRMFFYHEYEVSELCDRMGYRLKGPAVSCKIDGILSEGISLGAIQVPKDGMPIILMNDRQTIGGYPKMGSVLSLDLAKLAQLTQGAKVRFEPITIDHAHNELHLAKYKFENSALEPVALQPVELQDSQP